VIKRLIVLVAAVASSLPVACASAGLRTYFSFHRYTNTNSTLTIIRQDTTTGRNVAQESFRAGSGTTTNECESYKGWLPAGWYTLVGHFDHYDGSSIKGRAWQLSDKRCAGTGTLRTELFIHSEETASQGQYCPTSGDDPFCWEGDFDYKSAGCIKLAHAPPYPSDIARADSDWDGWDGRSGYFTVTNVLNVS